jgi:hypothetical protein
MQVSLMALTQHCRPLGWQPASATRKDHKLGVHLFQ